MRAARVFWASFWVVGWAFQLHALLFRPPGAGETFSENTRWWWHVDTRAGKIAFTAAYAGFSAWFVPHVLFGGRRPE